jgi:hypothetical protein
LWCGDYQGRPSPSTSSGSNLKTTIISAIIIFKWTFRLLILLSFVLAVLSGCEERVDASLRWADIIVNVGKTDGRHCEKFVLWPINLERYIP